MPGVEDPVAGKLRAGGRALLLLADPVSVSILRGLAPGPLESTDLMRRVCFASRSTFFERVRDLEGLSLVSRERRRDVPPVAECRLEASGLRLLGVARRLDGWLGRAPQGPLELGQAYAAASVKALAVAWGSTMLRWLAERPRTLSELDQLVKVFGHRKLERIIRHLVEAGLVERVSGGDRLSPYGVTEWGCWAAGLLAAAMRWERHEIARWSAPVGPVEAEGVLLLGSPLAELPVGASGTCALLVDAELPDQACFGGAIVRIASGRAVSWGALGGMDPRLVEPEVDCWVRGRALAWLSTHASAPGPLLRVGGDVELADHMLAALRHIGSEDHGDPSLQNLGLWKTNFSM